MSQPASGTFKTVLDFVYTIFGRAFLPILIPFIAYIFFLNKIYKQKLENKVVLITGASSGLGEALAHVFYTSGCKVILASRRVNELERVKKDLLKIKTNNETHEPKVLQLDLLDIDSLNMKATEAEQIHGQIDIVIHNGGVSYRGDIVTTSMDVHINVMTVNYFGPIALTKALLPAMIARGNGHIVGISSVQGRIAIPHRSAYAASKHALQSYLDCLRSELADKNIKVTTVNPGYINTNLSRNAITGSGKSYGVTDPNTAGGFDPNYVANKVLKSVIHEKHEVTIATVGPRLAILSRSLLPDLYFFMMKRKAHSSK